MHEIKDFYSEDLFGDWIKNEECLKQLQNQYKNGYPYPHVVIENFLSENCIENILKEFPDKTNNKWKEYKNPIEYKYAFDDIKDMGEITKQVFFSLYNQKFINTLDFITEIDNLEKDEYLHGGGLHFHPNKGKLNMHLDYSIHPFTGKERRINIIIYLNKNWKEEYGGHLELWSKGMSQCVKKLLPDFNKAIIFQTFDESWHGLPHRITCPENDGRKSLAIYYVSKPRQGIVFRPKAQFVPLPEEMNDEKLVKLCDIRATRRIEEKDLIEIYGKSNPDDL